jgi:hypothetical protein
MVLAAGMRDGPLAVDAPAVGDLRSGAVRPVAVLPELAHVSAHLVSFSVWINRCSPGRANLCAHPAQSEG